MFASLFCAAAALAGGASTQADITVEDVVRQAVIGDPGSLSWNDRRNTVSVFAPDGRHVAVVIRGGNPEAGTNDAELLVYESASLMQGAEPMRLARFASASNHQPISQVRWLDDSETLVFAATQGSKPPQVFRVSLRDRKQLQITDEVEPMRGFDASASGERIVMFVSERKVPMSQDAECISSGCRVTARWLRAALDGYTEHSSPLVIRNTRDGSQREMPRPEAMSDELSWCDEELQGGLSPDGRFALRKCDFEAGRWPAWWTEYTADQKLGALLAQGNTGYAGKLLLADLDSGTYRAVPIGPYIARSTKITWLEGGKQLLITDAFESLDGVEGAERDMRKSQTTALLIEPEALRVTRMDAVDAKALEARVARHESGIRLEVEQSLNDRPVLVAVDSRSGKKRPAKKVLMDPNPWLSQRQPGRVEAIAWQSRDGSAWSGGLYYPPRYESGRRYPLVLQTHGFRPNRFSLHGVARNFAAQPLAARDIVVLQVQEGIAGVVGTPQEWPAVQAGYEAAIDKLDSLQLIDRERVGIVGWSRTGPHAGYTLTHSAYPFKAAAFTDSADFGWWYYMTSGAMRELEVDYGAAPFGAGLDRWQELSPTFNLDRMRTPLLMWTGDATGLWDWYTGLRRLDKPVEYWVFPEGVHDAFKVRERLRGGHLLVDWFAFWLNGEEIDGTGKREQYARWRAMREMDGALAGPRN